MAEKCTITISVITCKRPDSLADTLHSLAGIIIPPDVAVRLLVVDNDISQSASDVVHSIRNTLPFPARYVVEEKRGIPYARNRALNHAHDSDYIAFIDDDDTADPQWLCELYRTAERYSAQVVKGRIIYTFSEGKSHLQGIDIFSDVSEPTGTDLDSAWTNNVLFSTGIYRDSGMRFDTAFSKTGGSDYHFFRCAKRNGARIVMCKEAIVRTSVPDHRTAWRWLAARHARVGATLTFSDIKINGYCSAMMQTASASFESIKYFSRLAKGILKGDNPVVHPVMVLCFIAGRILGIFHVSPREYK